MFGIERAFKDPVNRTILIMPVILAVLMTAIVWNIKLQEFVFPASILGAIVLLVYFIVGGYVTQQLLHRVLNSDIAPEPVKRIERLSATTQAALLLITLPIVVLYLALTIIGLAIILMISRAQTEHQLWTNCYRLLMSKPLKSTKLQWFRPLYVVALVLAITTGLLINENARAAIPIALIVFLGVSVMPWVVRGSAWLINRWDERLHSKSSRHPSTEASTAEAGF